MIIFQSYYFASCFEIGILYLFPEYSTLDKQLDSLNSVLDVLEHKNDQIHEQLKALLENSREIRINMAQENKQDEKK